MWTARQLARLSGASVVLGAFIGAVYGFGGTALEELALPSGPTWGLPIIAGCVGTIVGALVAGIASAVGSVAIVVSVLWRMSALARALLAGLGAGLAAFAAAGGLFFHDGIIGATEIVTGIAVAAALLAAGATRLCEHRATRPGDRRATP